MSGGEKRRTGHPGSFCEVLLIALVYPAFRIGVDQRPVFFPGIGGEQGRESGAAVPVGLQEHVIIRFGLVRHGIGQVFTKQVERQAVLDPDHRVGHVPADVIISAEITIHAHRIGVLVAQHQCIGRVGFDAAVILVTADETDTHN